MKESDIFITKIQKIDPKSEDMILINVNRENRYTEEDLNILKDLRSKLMEKHPDVTFIWVPFSSNDFEMSKIGNAELDELLARIRNVKNQRTMKSSGSEPNDE